jgi:hypothetical protein
MNDHGFVDSLAFARKRLDQLRILNGGDLAGASHEYRQPLIQEFFFHLVGAIDKLMHVVNESRLLAIPTCQVTAKKVFNKLGPNDQLRPLIEALHPETQHSGAWLPLPQNQYSDNWHHFRIMVFRHWINHCGENPFAMRVGSQPRISLFIDPRDPALGGSKLAALDELGIFWHLVNSKCYTILNML